MNIIRQWLHMCEHKNCWQIFVPLRKGILFDSWYLCDKHKYHVDYIDWDCSISCK